MKLTDWLRKLSIFRSGLVAKKYHSGRDLPLEFIDQGVMNRDKDVLFDFDKRRAAAKAAKGNKDKTSKSGTR